MRKLILSISIAASLFGASLISQKEFGLVQSVLPNTKISKVEHTLIDGLYAAFLPNGNVIYVYPYKRLIFFGEIYTNTGINLTNKIKTAWKNKIQKERLKKINAEELLKNSFEIKFGKGSNKYEIVVFTDPECPFCRRVDKFVKDKNITFHINYMPLYFHPHAKKWALEILSSKNKKKAIETIEKTNKDLNITITKEAKKTLKATQALARKLGIRGTPTMFVIDTKTNKVIDVINGANIPKLQKWIEKDKEQK